MEGRKKRNEESAIFVRFTVGHEFVPSITRGWGSQLQMEVGTRAGMYPILIIVIVNFKRTIWEEYPITTLGHGSHSLTGRSGATRTNTRPEVGIHLDVCDAMRRDSGNYRRDKQRDNEEFSSPDWVVVL
jgi:hypothetical protein